MNHQDAKQQFKQAIHLCQSKRFAEALPLLNELDRTHPLTQNILYPKARCLAALGETDEALQVCEQLQTLFQDPRARQLEAQLRASMLPAGTAPRSGARKGSSSAASKGKKVGFSWRLVAALLVMLTAGVAAAIFLRSGKSSEGREARERPKPSSTDVADSAQAAIDAAIRRNMETSAVPPFATLYDTGTLSKSPLTPDELTAQQGWTQVPEGELAHNFTGDAVLMNNQICLVLRKEGAGAELCGRSIGFRDAFATLVPRGKELAQGLGALSIVQSGQDEVVVEATHKTGGAETLKVRYVLAMGQVFVKVTPAEGATRLRVSAPSRFAVLPDFFADDMVLDARETLSDQAELPSENFLLHMAGDGKAIVMNVWDNRNQDVQLVLEGQEATRLIQSSEIAFGEGGAVWVALLTGQGIWHMREIRPPDKGKEMRLDWRCPYPALWRTDWQRSDKLTDSWEMLTETSKGEFKKHGLFSDEEDAWTAQDWWGGQERTRIASGLGRFKYPCWVDLKGQGWFQPLATEAWGAYEPLKGVPDFVGPAIIYPLNRLSDTPLDKFTVVDVVRASLGVGPCQYILDVEGQSEEFQGMPTCSVQDILDGIYANGRQKMQREQVERALNDVVAFITLIRGRIDEYGEFAIEMTAYLKENQGGDVAQTPFIEEMLGLAGKITTAIDERQESIKSVKYAKNLADDFRSELLDYTGADAAEKCKKYTEDWVGIGGNQDTLVAECRVAVKLLRQRAALSLTRDPARAQLVGEIRARTEKILRAPVNYEAPRH